MISNRQHNEPGNVYFIHDPSQAAVKIGWTGVGISQRLRAFNDARAHPDVYLLGVLPGTMQDERRLHGLFATLRIRREWFRATDALLATVRKMLIAGGQPLTVADELRRRNNCRSGLRGVTVAINGRGDAPFTIHSTRWITDRRLLLRLDDAEVLANDCFLLSEWPVVCRCWCGSEVACEVEA